MDAVIVGGLMIFGLTLALGMGYHAGIKKGAEIGHEEAYRRGYAYGWSECWRFTDSGDGYRLGPEDSGADHWPA